MNYIKHYFKILFKILTTSYNYSKITLLLHYIRLLFKSVVHHKIKRLQKESLQILEINALGFSIQFYTYAQLINLFEEIFIYQAYGFKSKKSIPIIIDCGSNIGLSILYFKKVYPSSEIIAFEPDKDAYLLLTENIRINNISNTTLHNCALSDMTGQAFLYKTTSPIGSLTMSLIDSSDKPITEIIQSNQLSTYITNSVDFIKMDVEGSEIKIIDDLITNKKLEKIDQLTIEYHPSITKIPAKDFSSKIEDHGFLCNLVEDTLHKGATEIIINCKNTNYNFT